MMKYINILLIILLCGCQSMVQKSGEMLEGKAFSEKTLAVYQSFGKDDDTEILLKQLKLKDGTEIHELTSSEWPSLSLRGIVTAGGKSFHFTEAHFLSSHIHGWNEFVLDLNGSAELTLSGGTIGRLRITEEIERVQLSSGRIRLKSSRLTGNAALTPLRHRRERILALIEWMEENEDKPIVENLSRKDFESYWKPRLFPEMVMKDKRPPAYTKVNAEFVRADSIRWNTNYTEQLLPEELWELRNTGGMLRDWEEALYWIYMEYSWNGIISSFNDTNLLRIK